jgi:hypothetical protein
VILNGKVEPRHRQGVFSTEAWVDVNAFYSSMEHYGVRQSQLMELICEKKINTPFMA